MSGELMLFLGRFHPVFVHLPIGLLVLLAFLEVMARWPRFHYANSNAGLIIGVAAPLSAITAGLGWLLSTGGGYDAQLLRLHQYTGFGTAAGALVAGLAYAAKWRGAYLGVLFLTVATLGVSSHFGGSLTHGRDYLTRYAPPGLREWLKGPKPKPAPQPTPQPLDAPGKPELPSEPPLFSRAIAPVLEDKCVSCHGPEKAKGGLRVDSLEAILKGGDSGPGVVAGKPGESEIIKRILLPLDDDEHMPPDGKPQLTVDEVALLRAWVEAGASATTSVSAAQLPTALARSLAKDAAAPADARKTPEPDKAPPLPREEIRRSVAKLVGDLGVPIGFLSEKEPWVQLNASVAGSGFGDEQLWAVAALGANLRWLDLSGTSITGEGLRHLTNFPNLTRLYLQRTKIGDDVLTNLSHLSRLEYLNLYGTSVSGQGLQALKPLPGLRHLYVWQTQVSAAEAKAFAESKVDRAQIAEWERQISELKARIKNAEVIVDVGFAASNAPVAARPAKADPTPVNAACPVSGKPVDAVHTFVHEGTLIGFCCEHCKAKFQEDPKAYLGKVVKKSE